MEKQGMEKQGMEKQGMEKQGMEKQVKGWDLLCLGLYAFAGLGIEAIYAYLLEPILYGCQMQEWNMTQSIIHWIITCITWGLVSYLILRTARVQYGINLFEKTEKIKLWQWICVFLCMIFTLTLSYLDWDGFKIVIEFQHNGLIKFIFQYIYYVFETVLFSLIIIFAQKAFEVWFKNKRIPYGGIILALTWGLAHTFTKGSLLVGLYTAFGGFLFGIVYLLLNRNMKWTLPVLFVMFML